MEGRTVDQVVILAGGLGTRLGSISEKTPKSLVEVAGRPILSHILGWASTQGCRAGLILTGHLGEQFDDYRPDCDISLSFHQEPHPLGTGGALWNARELLEDRFVLLWGDDLHMVNYPRLLETHISSGCDLTITVTGRHSSFNLKHEMGRVVRYDKHLTMPSGLNGYEAGTSIVQKSLLEAHGRDDAWSWEEVVYPSMSGLIAAHLDDAPFWDIGTPEGLALLESFLKEG